MTAASPTTAQGISWTPPLAEVCIQSSQGGVSEPETMVQWNVWLCTCGLQTWSHSLSPIPLWHSLPAVDVSLWCPESVLENRSPGHRQRVLWRCPWQYKRAAHLSSVQNMTQPGHRQLEHLPLGRIRQRVLSQFWIGFGGPWDIPARTQAVCLWGQPCEGLGWYHIARLFHRPFPSQIRDQMPAAFVQRHLGGIFRDSPGDQLCYDVSWNHTGFCLVSWIFPDSRWSEY